MRYSFTIFLALINGMLMGQNIDYARKLVNTLAAEEMHGRGYYKGGVDSAAHFLKREMKRLGLSSFEDDFLQTFPIELNTFPGKVEFAINGRPVAAGKHFVVHASSGSVKGEFILKRISYEMLEKPDQLMKEIRAWGDGVALLFDVDTLKKKERNEYRAAARELANVRNVVSVVPKLTWTIAPSASKMAHVQVLKDSVAIAENDSVEFNVKNIQRINVKTSNVIGYIPGTKKKKKYLVFSAHYDHLGHMGPSVYFPGANDNASGTAMLLDLARHYKEKPAKYTVVFMAFAAEEAGILGSKYYVENPYFPLKKIKFLINMDIMGTGDEGITVVNGRVHTKQYDCLTKINGEQGYLSKVKSRGKAANSDHYWFSEQGVPAFFIYTMGGIKAYHDVYDRPETLPLTEYEDAFRLIRDFADSF